MISSKYGEGTFDFYGNDITITISFRFINEVGNKVGNNVGNKIDVKMTPNRKKILSEVRNNPNITSDQLSVILGINVTAVQNNIEYLRSAGCIERTRSNESGYWKVKD